MNRLCEILGIEYPILLGGLGNVSNAPLAAAVSEAGGLGTLGAGTMPPGELEQKIRETKERTHKPIAVNIPIKVTPYLKEVLDLIQKYEIPVVSLSAGNPRPLIDPLRRKGIRVITVVAAVKQALKAEEAGTDVIVAEGCEAAGINSAYEITTMALIPQIVDAVNVPVVAAGGIADARGFVAALALGASGVQMGTRFVATQEAAVSRIYKDRIVSAGDAETVVVGRSLGKLRRLLRTPSAEQILELERRGLTAEEYDRLTDEEHHRKGALEGNLVEGYVNGGQIAGLIRDLPTVKEVIEGIVQGAKEVQERIHLHLAR